TLYAGLIGAVCGEFCVVILLSGLTASTWFNGFMCGCWMMAVWFLGLIAGFWFAESIKDFFPVWLLCPLPGSLLLASSPLIAFRIAGWRLVPRKEELARSQPFRIADLLHA